MLTTTRSTKHGHGTAHWSWCVADRWLYIGEARMDDRNPAVRNEQAACLTRNRR